MKIKVTVSPAVLDISDSELEMRTATGVSELVRARINEWFPTGAIVDWHSEQQSEQQSEQTIAA
jgi:hypothetical protein